MNKRQRDRVNKAMSFWRQGDITLEGMGMFHVADLSLPHSEASRLEAEALVAAGLEISSAPEPVENIGVHGLVVTTQTCDIARDCEDRPWVDVSPLVRVRKDMILDIKRWRMPRYGWIAATEGSACRGPGPDDVRREGRGLEVEAQGRLEHARRVQDFPQGA